MIGTSILYFRGLHLFKRLHISIIHVLVIICAVFCNIVNNGEISDVF